ncbi:hypothetical protein QZH41_015679 [Actinostola sp. cb2023]|nr:hypothetical protein QZH41_015679 [Actinostola sp. cb2023]
MAALKRRSESVDSNVGHFYYDWALSRYKWMPQDVKAKQNNLEIQQNESSNEKVKPRKNYDQAAVNIMNNFIPLGFNERDNIKKPLQNRDVNQPIKEERGPIKPDEDVNQEVPIRKTSVPAEPIDELSEIAQSHSTMLSVLSTRLLRLRAAETLWHKDTNEFIEYVLRLKDDSLLVDVLPLLTSRVKENAPEGRALSMGACLEMLPVLERLLGSKFEDYIVVALNMVREMIKRWWTQLKLANSKTSDPEYYRCSRSIGGLYMAMVSISAIIARLKGRKGRVGEKALVS